MPALTPPTSARIQTFDVIQGLALLGLLMVNSQTYSLFTWLSPNQVHLNQPESRVALRFFIQFLVQGPLPHLISFLCGLSFYHIWQMFQLAGANANRIIFRGLCVLFIFGIVHGIVFWFGDMLHQYALLGFTLLYFNKQSTRTVLLWTAGMFGFIILLSVFQTTPFTAIPHPFITDSAGMDPFRMKIMLVWQQGSFIKVMQEQIHMIGLRYLSIFEQAMVPFLYQELLLLLGLALGKSNLLNRLDQIRPQLSLLLLVLFPLAVLLNGINTLLTLGLFPWTVDWAGDNALLLTSILGSPLLALIYVMEISLYTRNYPKVWAIWVGQVGKMGLTNYLMQTLMCMACFYGYGLGLGARVTLLESLYVVAAIYGAQLLFSHWWLSRYELGPVEWLWNKLAMVGP